jgi:vancomycin resistance protein YoaR
LRQLSAGIVLLVTLLAARSGAGDPAAGPTPADSAGDAVQAAFPVELGSFATTLIGSSPARTANVRLAASALDGVVLDDGAELSFNDRVGTRTAERGYQVAPVILREERQLQLGGGICQVASTLFDAGLLAGLSPIERWRHSSPVDYVALGQDATIAWGYKDLKLRNETGHAVRLRVAVVGATLLARILGVAPNPLTYELVTDGRDVPASTDANLPGHEVELYRVTYADGREVGRELVHRDLYPSARRSRLSGQ